MLQTFLATVGYGNIVAGNPAPCAFVPDSNQIRRAPDMDTLLSEREKQVLQLAATGHTDKEIARELEISTATVTTYWARIRSKMGGRGRTELVAQAVIAEVERSMATTGQERQRLERELDRRSRSEQYLKAACDLMRSVIDLAPQGVIVTDCSGKVVLSNLKADQILGHAPGQGCGRSLPTNPSALASLLAAAASIPTAVESQLVLRIAGGKVVRLAVHAIRYQSGSGELLGFVLWLTSPEQIAGRAAAALTELESI